MRAHAELIKRWAEDEAMEPPNIIFYVSGNTEMIRIAKDGFWVRGVKLEQDETEARKLFDALMKFLGEVRK